MCASPSILSGAMTRKLIFVGCSHTSGEGAEWPHLCQHIDMPAEFSPEHRYPYLREQFERNDYNQFNQTKCRRDFVDFLDQKFGRSIDEHPLVNECRSKLSWATTVGEMYGLPVDNLGRPGASNDLCLTELMKYAVTNNLTDSLVVFTPTYMHRHFVQVPTYNGSYHDHEVNRLLDEIEVSVGDWRINDLARTIWLMSSFCRSEGARFVWTPFDEYLVSPISGVDFWDSEHNQFARQAGEHCLGFEPVAFQLNEEVKWRRYDGHHFDSIAQKEIAKIYRKLLKPYI